MWFWGAGLRNRSSKASVSFKWHLQRARVGFQRVSGQTCGLCDTVALRKYGGRKDPWDMRALDVLWKKRQEFCRNLNIYNIILLLRQVRLKWIEMRCHTFMNPHHKSMFHLRASCYKSTSCLVFNANIHRDTMLTWSSFSFPHELLLRNEPRCRAAFRP